MNNESIAINILKLIQPQLITTPTLEERLFRLIAPLLLIPEVVQFSPVEASQCAEEAILSEIFQPNSSYESIYNTNHAELHYPEILFRHYFPCVSYHLFEETFSNLQQFRYNHLHNARPLRDIVAEYVFQHALQLKNVAVRNQPKEWRNVIYWSIVSYYLDPENHQRLMNIGVLLMEYSVQSHMYGFFFAQLATILIDAQRKRIFQAYLEQYGQDRQLSMENLHASKYLNSHLQQNPEKRQVAIYCYEYGQAWWPGNLLCVYSIIWIYFFYRMGSSVIL
jgi:hypothetical protein